MTFFVFVLFIGLHPSFGQLRKVYTDSDPANELKTISFFSPSEGFVAFAKDIGFTTDSGKTFIKKRISISNVDFNGYTVGITFGFAINGIKAFDRNNILVYGDYGEEASILSSTDGGSTFKLVYHEPFNPNQTNTVAAMTFVQNSNVGFAVTTDYVLKTTNKGSSWSIVLGSPGLFFAGVEAADNNTIFAFGTKNYWLFKSVDGGSNWQSLTLPLMKNGKIGCASFINANTGWLAVNNIDGADRIYKTINGGAVWTLQNDSIATPFRATKMIFLDDQTGYALNPYSTSVFKTLDGGATWEPLSKDNSDFFSYNDLQNLSATQLWAGGATGVLEMSTNAGGTPLPKAYFIVDTTGVGATDNVNLLNYSRPGYTYKWFVNNVQVGSDYNGSYTHVNSHIYDTIKLVVSNGVATDTAVKYFLFPAIMRIQSFNPAIGARGTKVLIKGENFKYITSVTFGGTPAWSYTVLSDTLINAEVAFGSSGNVRVSSSSAYGSAPGFTYLPAPAIDLPTTVSKPVLCKAESVVITLQNTEPNVRYDLLDSLNNVWGSVQSTGGTAVLTTSQITRTGNYTIKAVRTNVVSTAVFTKKIFLTVEHTTSVFTGSKINILPGEKVDFVNHSLDAQSFSWTLQQDASLTNASSRDVPGISYGASGQKTITLISVSDHGCRDTLTANAVYVYQKPQPDLSCYAMNIVDSNYSSNTTVSPATISKISTTSDDGYLVTGYALQPALKSNVGVGKQFAKDNTAYLGKYTKDGVLSWAASLSNISTIFKDPLEKVVTSRIYCTEKDNQGNIYAAGICCVKDYLILPSGDSIKIAATTADTTSYTEKVNGFIVKLSSEGKYLWHVVLDNPAQEWQGYAVVGGRPLQMKIAGDNIAVMGQFSGLLNYYKNGTATQMFNLNRAPKCFIMRMKTDASLVWSSYLDAASMDVGANVTGLDIDAESNIYYAGVYKYQATLYEAGNTNNIKLTGPGAAVQSFIVKADADGKIVWNAGISTGAVNGNVKPTGLQVSSVGDCYVSGVSSVEDSRGYLAITSAGGKVDTVKLSGFLMKFDKAGNYKWSVGDQYSSGNQRVALCLNQDRIYTTGTLTNTPATPLQTYKMTSTDGTFVNKSLNYTEFYVATYDLNGVLQKVTSSGQNNGGHFDNTDIAVDSKGNYFISGFATSSYGSNNAFTLFNNSITTDGSDCFILKLNPNYCYVSNPPVASAGPDRTICKKATTGIGSTAKMGESYFWSSKPEGLYTVVSNPIVNPTETTEYYLTVTNNAGEISKDTVIITVVPSPDANAGTDRTICKDAKITIGADGVDGNTYSWSSSPAGFSSSLAKPDVTPSATTNYFLYVTNTAGCVAKDTVLITVAPNAITPAVSISSTTTNICEGSHIDFTAQATNGGQNPKFVWLVNDTIAGTNKNTFISYSLKDKDEVKVALVSSAGCVTSDSVVSNSILAEITANQTPLVSITSSTTSACVGETVVFNAVPVNGGDLPQYTWYVNNQQVLGQNNASYSITANNDFSVKVILTSNVPCPSPRTVESNVVAVTADYVINPQVSIKASATAICSGNTVKFTATPNTEAALRYDWTINGKSVGKDTSVYETSTLANGDVVKVSVTVVNNKCVPANTTATSNAITMGVDMLVMPAVQIDGNTTVTKHSFTSINAVTANTWGNVTYQWQDSTSLHSWQNISNANATSITYSPSTTGDKIRCITTSLANCGTRTYSTISNSLSFVVSETDVLTNSVRLYPNPATDKLTISIDGLNTGNKWSTLEIRTASGNLTGLTQNISGLRKITVFVDKLTPGMYIAILRNENGESVRLKFMKL
ncbi:T9SS type A sorting domain-containing protein [Chitinophagaceae bacterium 26-R-25]|nr:T9SS type A sorting domain-containing protein [Chitinophagaceae bacterium 26-R-25]